MKEEFFKAHKDLAGEEALVDEIVAAHKGRGLTYNSRPEMFTAIADHARKVLTKVRTPGTTQQPPAGQAAQPARQMTPTSMGGRSGGQQQRTQRPNSAELVFGKDAR